MQISVKPQAITALLGVVMVVSTGCVVNNPTVAPPPRVTQTTVTSQPSTADPPPAPATNPPSATRTNSAISGPGTYSFSFEGATGAIQVPTPRLDPRLEKVGDYRRLAKAPVVTYLIATVDNQSNDAITMDSVVVITGSGHQIEATPVSDYVDKWRESFAGDSRNYSRGITLSNDSRVYLLPGAKGTAILAAKEPITSVKRVFVYPTGIFPRVEAHRSS